MPLVKLKKNLQGLDEYEGNLYGSLGPNSGRGMFRKKNMSANRPGFINLGPSLQRNKN